MPMLRAHNLSVSLDGYLAGPHQGADHPLGVGGERLHDWAFATRTFRRVHGLADSAEADSETDDDFARRGEENIGATIMGRNMFGPVRGPWEDERWTGWWGENPPFHHPVFVLTHHPREPVRMRGGTVYHFVTDGIRAALERAMDAAGGRDVRLAGGAATVRQYLRAGLLDRLHVAIVPILLGGGEHLLGELGEATIRYTCTRFTCSNAVMHVEFSPAGRD